MSNPTNHTTLATSGQTEQTPSGANSLTGSGNTVATAIASGLLTGVNAWLALLSIAARRGDDGTEYVSFFLAPLELLLLIFILAGLLRVGLSKKPLTTQARRRRLLASAPGLLSTLAVWILF
jgi:hypothetical protein